MSDYRDVFRAVYADTLMCGYDGVNGDIVFQQAQLFEFFDSFQRALIQGNKFFKNTDAERIDTDVNVNGVV